MIYGRSLSFNNLIDKIQQLNERINQIKLNDPTSNIQSEPPEQFNSALM